MELDALCDQWVQGRKARGEIRPNSAAVLRARLTGLVAVVGSGPVDRAAVQRWQETIGHLAPSTRRAYLATARGFCQWLVLEGHLDQDPTLGVARVREPRRVPRALPERDVVALVDQVVGDLRLAAMVWLMVEVGLRCVEISNLSIGDFDPHMSTLTVRGKGDHERIVPLPGPARAALDRYLQAGRRRPGRALFQSIGSRRPGDGRVSARQISRQVGAAMRAAGVHRAGDGRSAHALRHTCASDVLERCGDVRIVQELLGHQSLATTQIYLRRASIEQLRRAVDGRDYRGRQALFLLPGESGAS
jgi:site-specific recombinase XerD